MTIASHLWKTAGVFLMVSLGGACGSVSGVSSPDAGTAGNEGSAGTAGSDGTAGSRGTAGATFGTAGGTGNGGSAGSPGIDGGIDGGIVIGPGHPVSLGKAGDYVILAKTGISTVPASVITGDLGVSPIAATAVTGFSLTADSTNVFSRSPQVTGKVYAANYASPTPSNLTTAVGDMQLAFTEAAGRSPGVTELGAGNIGGMALSPGVYKWGTGLLIPTNVTLTGTATDVWIFQIAKSLTLSGGAKIVLGGAALPKNIFWQVSGLVSVGTTAHLEGIVLSQTSITLGTGASINGRLLAQTAVALQVNTVVAPAP
jgi:hypothetical protein